MGRLVKLSKPSKLKNLVSNIKEQLRLDHVQVALSKDGIEHDIKTIAICAGWRWRFKGVEADLYYTGELSHHEALFFKESGSSVICCNHSNSERAFLKVIQEQLKNELNEADQVVISETDKDPFETW